MSDDYRKAYVEDRDFGSSLAEIILELTACKECGGKGHYYVMPQGMNPFYMGAIAASKAAEQRICRACGGTGKITKRWGKL